MTFLVLLLAGFCIPFIVLDLSRAAARRHWPSAQAVMADNFRPFPVLLALFAGPALFLEAFVRMCRAGRVAPVDAVLAAVIGCGWAICYGLVVVDVAGGLGLMPH